MKGIILAAGRGSRMAELTNDKPKCLSKVRNIPLIEWQMKAMRDAGIHDIGIVTGYKRELLQSYDLHEFHNPRWASTNMVSSLEMAEDWLNKESCVVSYSDIFYQDSAVKLLMDSPKSCALTYDPNWLELWSRRFENPLDDAETFRITSDGRVTEIGNKPKSTTEVQGQYMGLLRFTPTAWTEVKALRSELPTNVQDKMHMTGTLQKMIDRDFVGVYGIPYCSLWGEVDNSHDLKFYNDTFGNIGR
jgi:L-glutamine-phosphate cytidylyltransferase